ncbi:hypothetical protein DFQ14_11325 [Halopolyspora algeriensis]|uniref:Uncharacterized protein n=1 Tax=Halopolyspora algeriensis TaxID=1500506 RepID=A0A368VHW6_9ACTN|nr:hypothetical protein DFQ14_11325 [Halopolyspora algeriensis]TQM46619.1 hypothetical protein FHU43_3737 [Halopolyspora algeriensis]
MIGLARWSVNRLLRWRLAALEATSGSHLHHVAPCLAMHPSEKPEVVTLLRLSTHAKTILKDLIRTRT